MNDLHDTPKQDSVPELTVPQSAEIAKETAAKIQVVPHWTKIFFTYSFLFHMASIILTFVDQLLPFIGLLEPTMTTQTYAIVMFSLNALGVLSRFIQQKKLWRYDPDGKIVTEDGSQENGKAP